ncbi:MAG: M23 family metallopeptidase [Rhizobiaceae bacterium]
MHNKPNAGVNIDMSSPSNRKGQASPIEESLGIMPPLISGNGRRRPDKRRVSLRWMAGSILTGVTSVLLMGGALHAALDGRQQLAQPASILNKLTEKAGEQAEMGNRPVTIIALQPVNEHILHVPTVTKVGDSNVIRKRPFAYASAPLAIAPKKGVSYPKFNPLTVFRASGADNTIISSDVIYGADIEGEVRIQQIPFPLTTAQYDTSTKISAHEAEFIVRLARVSLIDGQVQTAALPYLDTTRFALNKEDVVPVSGLDIRIIAQNVSTMESDANDDDTHRTFIEEVLSVPDKHSLSQALENFDFQPIPLKEMIAAMIGELGKGPMAKGTKLRIVWEQVSDPSTATGTRKTCRRISVYRAGDHIKSVALSDAGVVKWAVEPAPIEAIAANNPDTEKPVMAMVGRSKLPNIYDGLYRAALSQGLSTDHARRVVRTVAFDVDFRSKIKPTDDLEIFYSLEEGLETASSNSEILYIGLTLSGLKRTYYRFKANDDGSVDYYDSNGKSAKKFLLRKPVPNARFGSAFGQRRHPISRVVKMHWGADFSAPRGTPILAAGNGIVEKAGWNSGYGKQTILRHANGYKTSYNHQHKFAKGIKVGARVVQGQIIGQVGSTGYSTGPHLHYEVIVNGTKVNPMKIRLPKGRVLKGSQLSAFKRERDRINVLLEKGRGNGEKVAALN